MKKMRQKTHMFSHLSRKSMVTQMYRTIHDDFNGPIHHSHIVQIGLRLAIAQTDARTVMPVSFR